MTNTKLSAPPAAERRQRAADARARGEAAARRLDSMAQMVEIHPGDVIADRYRVSAVLGRGRGLLLDAQHTGFDQRVVIRVISPALADAKAVDRFERETRILSKLETEHVARIMDVGTLPNGALYLVREHLEGISLAAHARAQRLGLVEAVDLFLQVCEAVQEAHSRGVVLRDLQPAHVFLTRKRNGEPVAKLTDFGTCKVMRQGNSDEQSCTKLLGLSSSASPELVRQTNGIDERADVWSLGCLLYELITGTSTFAGDGVALMLAIANEQPVPPSSLRRDTDIPNTVDGVVLRALCKSRSGRYQTVYQMASELRRFASKRGKLLVDQIARLAGENPPARPSEEDSMTFVRSVRPSEPPAAPRHAAHAPFPIAAPSQPAIPQPVVPQLQPVTASAPAPGYAPVMGGAYAPVAPASYPPAPSPLYPMRQPPLPQDLMAQEWPEPAPRKGRKALAALFALAPVCAVLTVFVLAHGAEAPLTAQAGWPVAPHVAPMAEEKAPEHDVASAPAVAAPVEEEADEEDEADEPSQSGESRASAAAPAAVAQGTPAREETSSQFLSASEDEKPAKSKKSKKSKKQRREEPKAETPVDSGAKGTIVAMAIGASCAFSVDGASRGSSSSVRVEVAAGNHTVSCQPVGGSRRSKSVTVKPGAAATAVFKF